MIPSRRCIAHFVYLAAIAVATVGWLCFIAWVAMYFV
jgi:fatty acid desaturase